MHCAWQLQKISAEHMHVFKLRYVASKAGSDGYLGEAVINALEAFRLLIQLQHSGSLNLLCGLNHLSSASISIKTGFCSDCMVFQANSSKEGGAASHSIFNSCMRTAV